MPRWSLSAAAAAALLPPSPLLPLLPPAFAVVSASDGGGKPSRSGRKKRCDTLKTALRYAQDKAPRDISAVLPVIVEKVNRELSGVVDVEVGWTGGESFHSRVGDHAVRCHVTRLVSALVQEGEAEDDGSGITEEEESTTGYDEEGRKTVTQCFDVPFVILDTDECSLPVDHPMRHACAPPSTCVNTIGSYECVCPAAASTSPSSSSSGDAATSPPKPTGKAVDATYFSALEHHADGDPWSLSLNSTSRSSCPGRASTAGCCEEYAHTTEGTRCRAKFHCAQDPCSSASSSSGKKPKVGGHDCAPSARCVRRPSPLSSPDHDCRCPRGLMGNGRRCRRGIDPDPRPTVEFDGVTPTEETVRNGYYCGCTKPVVDACAGFPKCEGKHEICAAGPTGAPSCVCKPGYTDAGPPYECVDETPPVLKLHDNPNNDGINRLTQGDVYRERAVEIVDENAEEYLRSLKITYSRPLPPGCLAEVGRFYVNYTVATPWTSPPYVRVTRTVIIEDVDECKLNPEEYEVSCPTLVPKCDVAAGARCVNTIGSYTCQCPRYTGGDGFLPIGTVTGPKDGRTGKYPGAPEGYDGGTGCRDTHPPSVEVLGPNPKVFRVCKCGGLNGIMGGPTSGSSSSGAREEEERRLCDDQRSTYGRDIKSMIEGTGGAELCATHTRPNPSQNGDECARASDETHLGTVDLTSRVRIGDPVQTSELSWRVPYDVRDEAGNQAKTVWRDVVVEEVELGELERRVREEVLADRERERKEAVRMAVEADRRTRKMKGAKCPECPECAACPGVPEGMMSADQCDARCDERMAALSASRTGSCPAEAGTTTARASTVPAKSFLQSTIESAETVLEYGLAGTLLFIFAALLVFVVCARLYAWLFFPRDGYYYTREEDERAMLNSVTYYASPSRGTAPGTPGSAPAASAPTPASAQRYGGGGAAGNGIFSPQDNRVYGAQTRMFASPSPVRENGGGGIYASPSPTMSGPAPGSATPYNLRTRRY